MAVVVAGAEHSGGSIAAPDVTSIRLSRPKPIRETNPATIPATMETRPSALL